MRSLTILFRSRVVPKKNSKTARMAGNGRMYMHRKVEAVASQDAMHWEALDTASREHWLLSMDPCRVALTFSWNGRADTIGLAETVLDAMEGAVYGNDRQARSLLMDMQPKGGELEAQGISCRATIKEYGDDE
jgi:hypothetical protein